MILLLVLAILGAGFAFRRGGMGLLDSGAAALICFGVAVSVVTELLSLAGVMTPTGSAVAWLLILGAILWWIRHSSAAAVPARSTAAGYGPELAIVLVFVALTGIVAVLSAPNSYDGLTYHLPRVERWIAQGSLQPFAAHDPRQLFMPSWSEYAMLQFRLLSGGDHFANLVQWLGFAGACAGAALLCGALGGTRAAMASAAVLVATLPMAVAQASGTQTDVVAACWTVLACAYGYRLTSSDSRPRDAGFAAAALGLAMATKQTAILFAALALLPAAIVILRRRPRLGLRWAGASIVSVLVLAGPQLLRNLEVFGSMRGEPGLRAAVTMETREPNQVAGNVLRNLSLHFGTTWPRVNQAIAAGVTRLSRAMAVDPNDPRTTMNYPPFRAMPWHTHEEAAPNPLHLFLLIGSLAALPWAKPDRRQLAFVAMGVIAFVVFCAELKWQHYNSRLQTPWFVLALAWAGLLLGRLAVPVRRGLLVLFALAALPNALLNETRPLLTPRATSASPRGILSTPRNIQYFMHWPYAAPAYQDAARRIAGQPCEDVGVISWPDSWVYPILALARTSGSKAAFRDVDVTNASARFAGPPSPPCLLLQIGPAAATPPAWAARWRRISQWHGGLHRASVAVFAPSR